MGGTTARDDGEPPSGFRSVVGQIRALESLVEPDAREMSLSPLRWTLESPAMLATALMATGHPASHTAVERLLDQMGYGMRGDAGTTQCVAHPDHNAQFAYVNGLAGRFLDGDQPVISVHGTTRRSTGGPVPGRAAGPNERSEAVDIACDVALVAGHAVRVWWRNMGAGRYPDAHRLLVAAYGGGSNDGLWQIELARLSADLELDVTIAHLPPARSKWNTTEHRLFSFTTIGVSGRLTSYRTVVELSGSATTRTGTIVQAHWTRTDYHPPSAQVINARPTGLPLEADEWHGDWNQTVERVPRKATSAADAAPPILQSITSA